MIEYTFKQTTEAVRLCTKRLEMTTETKQNDFKLLPEVQRQYNLLREFNLEQAQAGDEIMFFIDYLPPMDVVFKGCTSDLNMIFVEYKHTGGINGKSYYKEELKMKPLCWIEGKPVYKGDVLYYNFITSKGLVVAEALTFEDGSVGIRTNSGGTFHFTQELTWDKPKEPHVHQDLIDAWKNGAKIQYYSGLTRDGYEWRDITRPIWSLEDKYRIRPEQKTKKSGWINLWKAGYSTVGVSTGSSVYSSKEDALAGLYLDGHLGAIEIHWEE